MKKDDECHWLVLKNNYDSGGMNQCYTNSLPLEEHKEQRMKKKINAKISLFILRTAGNRTTSYLPYGENLWHHNGQILDV